MSSLRRSLSRTAAWLEADNARSERQLSARPVWWHAGKVVFGTLCIVRAGGLALYASGLGSYALAAVFLAGGLGLAGEGMIMLLRSRQA